MTIGERSPERAPPSFRDRVFHIDGDNKWFEKKRLFTLTRIDLMTSPHLRRIPVIPIESGGRG